MSMATPLWVTQRVMRQMWLMRLMHYLNEKGCVDMKFINTDANAASLEMDLEMMELVDEKIAFIPAKRIDKKAKAQVTPRQGQAPGQESSKGQPVKRRRR